MIETTPEDTLGGILDRVGARFSKLEAIVTEKERVTYETMLDKSNSLASAMLKMGVVGMGTAIAFHSKRYWMESNWSLIVAHTSTLPHTFFL